jgi:hypothetical protein
VLLAIVGAHLDVLGRLPDGVSEIRAFEKKLAGYAFLPRTPGKNLRRAKLRALAKSTLKAFLPQTLASRLSEAAPRDARVLLRVMAQYVIPKWFVGNAHCRDEPRNGRHPT